MMRETIAALPVPNMNATRLKSNNPTSNHTSAPTITSKKAIIVVIFIFVPRNILCVEEGTIYALNKNIF